MFCVVCSGVGSSLICILGPGMMAIKQDLNIVLKQSIYPQCTATKIRYLDTEPKLGSVCQFDVDACLYISKKTAQNKTDKKMRINQQFIYHDEWQSLPKVDSFKK